MIRYALLKDDVVIKICNGNKPSEEWIEYPNSAPELSLFKVKKQGDIFIQTNESIIGNVEYDLARVKQYPTVGDQLDAIWKALDTLNLPAETKAVLDRIKQVKQEIPKPDKPK